MKKLTISLIAGILMLSFGCAGNRSIKKGVVGAMDLPKEMNKEAVYSIMEKVAHWQIEQDYGPWPVNFWVIGSMFSGLTEFAQIKYDSKILASIKEDCQSVNWKMGDNLYHGDFHTIGQTYLDFYEMEHNPLMIGGVLERFDWILANRSFEELTELTQTRWDWCDALYMAPPVWSHLSRITGDPKYMEFMDEEFMVTTEHLYDEGEHLYYRDVRFFEKREANGRKVFWSRGNGWVFGGLCRIMDHMPKDFHNRARYEEIFKDMAYKLVSILPEENLWHSSLLDPVAYPTVEASGSGFYLYGLVWGVNNGLLDQEYFMPYIIKIWMALSDCVQEDGKLGHVQAIGDDPRQVTADQTGLYGVGAFLMAGTEIYKMLEQ